MGDKSVGTYARLSLVDAEGTELEKHYVSTSNRFDGVLASSSAARCRSPACGRTQAVVCALLIRPYPSHLEPTRAAPLLHAECMHPT